MPSSLFKLVSDYAPSGDQPEAIEKLTKSLKAGSRYQTLLGVTGSGKTFTMANIIAQINKPTLLISHNKTLAAQLYSELKNFFPHNAVEYFVSYYDYYQPEAYLPQTDTYIEKDAAINEEIERLRLAATSSLVSREDVIVVASVSCIYGLGSPSDFKAMMIPLRVGEEIDRETLMLKLIDNLYDRNDAVLKRGTFRPKGSVVDIFPAYQEIALRVTLDDDRIAGLQLFDPIKGEFLDKCHIYNLYPANPYITPKHKLQSAIGNIRKELDERVQQFEQTQRLLEAQRIRQRTEYDLELLQEVGFCSGIENYSRHISGRNAGEAPECLLHFFPKNFITFIDESHVTVPQIRAMYLGDRVRKEKLVDFGFRLPSAMDNRPLKPEEFDALTGQTLFISATPALHELTVASTIAEQVIRPTGLLDPVMEVRPIKGQVADLIHEIHLSIEQGERVLVTTLTKRMSEDIAAYIREAGIRVEYLHSDIDAIERVEILRKLRKGTFDVLVGVNLLREGLDLPEVALVAILDADKEGFLRNQTSLIQTAGRAARHEQGRVILYADVMTKSLVSTIALTAERRAKQIEYNTAHGITPQSVKRAVQASLHEEPTADPISLKEAKGDIAVAEVIAELDAEMLAAAENLQFERAAVLRDQIALLRKGTKASKSKGKR
jgi:excinuclease ABC subunit B